MVLELTGDTDIEGDTAPTAQDMQSSKGYFSKEQLKMFIHLFHYIISMHAYYFLTFV